MLFSEPKIPQLMQYVIATLYVLVFQCSSASRKFLNVAVAARGGEQHLVSVLFSEPKIPQLPVRLGGALPLLRFSALQRAENSSISNRVERSNKCIWFQCSSASRKFLNVCDPHRSCAAGQRFSALQRAENSSICTIVQ